MDEKAQGHKGMRYAGGKNGAGVYQTIISMIPAHAVYVEAFAGSAAIARRIKPAGRTILMERDPAMADRLRAAMPAATAACSMRGLALSLNSVTVFHALQDGHLPTHCPVTWPQALQTNRVRALATGRSALDHH